MSGTIRRAGPDRKGTCFSIEQPVTIPNIAKLAHIRNRNRKNNLTVGNESNYRGLVAVCYQLFVSFLKLQQTVAEITISDRIDAFRFIIVIVIFQNILSYMPIT